VVADTCRVLVAHVILGVTALEQKGYRVDPVTGRLVRGYTSCFNELFESLYVGSCGFRVQELIRFINTVLSWV
jgi:hypothetical protein